MGSLYKITSKLLASSLRLVMGKLISINQSSFLTQKNTRRGFTHKWGARFCKYDQERVFDDQGWFLESIWLRMLGLLEICDEKNEVWWQMDEIDGRMCGYKFNVSPGQW